MSGRRLHHSAIFPGQVRFNSKSGFDPEFPLRAIGKTFQCSPPRQFAGKMHLLFERRTSQTMPDAYLVTLRSTEHGAIQFGKPGWKSAGVSPISISLRGPRYEAMLLFGEQDWVDERPRTMAGRSEPMPNPAQRCSGGSTPVRYYKGYIALSDTCDVPVLLHVRHARALCFDFNSRELLLH